MIVLEIQICIEHDGKNILYGVLFLNIFLYTFAFWL